MKVVLIPGLICDATVWQPVIAELARHRVDVADVTRHDSIAGMAAALLDDHPGPLVVAGHSMGGRVAMEMARLAPERIAALALLNTGIHPRREGEAEKRQAMIDLAWSRGMEALAQAWLPGMMAAGRTPDPAVTGALTRMVCQMTPEIHERQMRALLSRPDAGSSIGAYGGPMLLMTGRQDQWSPVSQHEDIARLCPQARLAIIEDAGHFAPVEQPQAVARLLADWVDGLPLKETAG